VVAGLLANVDMYSGSANSSGRHHDKDTCIHKNLGSQMSSVQPYDNSAKGAVVMVSSQHAQRVCRCGNECFSQELGHENCSARWQLPLRDGRIDIITNPEISPTSPGTDTSVLFETAQELVCNRLLLLICPRGGRSDELSLDSTALLARPFAMAIVGPPPKGPPLMIKVMLTEYIGLVESHAAVLRKDRSALIPARTRELTESEKVLDMQANIAHSVEKPFNTIWISFGCMSDDPATECG
jgi:hypothetical protein